MGTKAIDLNLPVDFSIALIAIPVTTPMHFHLSIDLPEDRALIPMLRRVTRDALALCQVSGQDIDDIELMIGELATNAVLHARAGTYRVEIDLGGDRAVVTVADEGAGFQREAILPPGTFRQDSADGDSDQEPRFGGLGLPLVEMLADEVTYQPAHPHGTVARASRRLRQAAVIPAAD